MLFLEQFTSSPICCPSRASLLSGQYAHNHQTTNNSVSGGCYGEHWKTNAENHTFPVYLQRNGYNTFYAGKYLNGVRIAFQVQGHELMRNYRFFAGYCDRSSDIVTTMKYHIFNILV